MSRGRVFRRHGRRQPLSEALRHYLESGELLASASLDDALTARSEALRRLWRAHRAEMLPLWTQDHPGTRPWAWWRIDAPEPRRRLGGGGTPCHEVLADEPEYDFGVPARWVSAWQV